MNALRVLTYKAFARFFRNRTAVALTFIVPIAMIYIFGQVWGLNRKETAPSGIPLAVVNESDHPAAQRLVAALQAETTFRVVTDFKAPDGTTRPLREGDVRPMIRNREFRFALIIPRDVIPDQGFGVRLKVLSNPVNDIETQIVNGVLQKTIFTAVPDLLGQSLQASAKRLIGTQRLDTFNATLARAIAQAFGGDPEKIAERIASGDFGFSILRSNAAPAEAASGETAPPKKNRAADFLARIVKIESEQVVGRNVKSPAATRVVGGWAIMFLLFALNGAATSLFEERKAGIFQRLLAGPVTRGDILWSRFVFGVVLGLVQLVTIFAVGSLLYGIDVVGHLGNLVLISTAAAAACTALGLFIASVSDTQEAAMGLATFVVLTMSAVGGAWFPISLLPAFMQQVSKFTVTYWAMEGFAQVLWAGNTLREILPTLGVLAAAAAGLMAIAIWRFNRGRLFE